MRKKRRDFMLKRLKKRKKFRTIMRRKNIAKSSETSRKDEQEKEGKERAKNR